jgi:hypothetical protein
LTEEDEVRIGESLQKLKGLFPAQSVPKGKALVLLRTPTGLTVEYEVSRPAVTENIFTDHEREQYLDRSATAGWLKSS